MARQAPIEIFMPPNILKAKVGSVAGGIDMAAIKRAEAAMEILKTEFNDWLADDISRLVMVRNGFANTPTEQMRADLFRGAHDLRGQADTYGFPLVARMASSLAKLLDDANTRNIVPLNLVDAHVAAIQIAFRDKITVAKDAVAIALATELEARVDEEVR